MSFVAINLSLGTFNCLEGMVIKDIYIYIYICTYFHNYFLGKKEQIQISLEKYTVFFVINYKIKAIEQVWSTKLMKQHKCKQTTVLAIIL